MVLGSQWDIKRTNYPIFNFIFEQFFFLKKHSRDPEEKVRIIKLKAQMIEWPLSSNILQAHTA